jgi:uncharacterized protein (UPF0335 family)
MDRKRLLELAVETLEKQKAGIDAEMESIRAEMKGVGSGVAGKVKPVTPATRKQRSKTPAQHKALSRKLKEIWAVKKRLAAKLAVVAKTAPARAKGRPKSKAEKKTLSLKMKQVWKQKRAEPQKQVRASLLRGPLLTKIALCSSSLNINVA